MRKQANHPETAVDRLRTDPESTPKRDRRRSGDPFLHLHSPQILSSPATIWAISLRTSHLRLQKLFPSLHLRTYVIGNVVGKVLTNQRQGVFRPPVARSDGSMVHTRIHPFNDDHQRAQNGFNRAVQESGRRHGVSGGSDCDSYDSN